MKKIHSSIGFITLLALVIPQLTFALGGSFEVNLQVVKQDHPRGGGAGGSYPVIYDVRVVPQERDAVITWKTIVPSRGIVNVGIAPHAEGVSVETSLSTTHEARVAGLSPETKYAFTIVALNERGGRDTAEGTFTTTILFGVPNVLSFQATARDKDIVLSWRIPRETDRTVRIVRSTNFYPASLDEGTVVYEGSASRTIDSSVEVGVRYFYTLFVQEEGRWSSGAVADARISVAGEPQETGVEDIFSKVEKAPFVHPQIASLTLQDFILAQPGRSEVFLSDSAVIEGSLPATIYIPYGRVPEVLKTIAITLSDPDDITKKFSFLLRINEEKTRYEATLAPLGRSGAYAVSIAIVDFKNQGMKQLGGSLLAVVSRARPEDSLFGSISNRTSTSIGLLGVLLLALGVWLFGKGRKEHRRLIAHA